jgi:Cu(I)/Ag(I) efflux system protein CusF
MKLALVALALRAAAPAYAQAPDAAAPAAPQAPAAATAEGSGQVKAVDAKAGAVTIHHSPIAALGWPAMTMTFKAAPEVVSAAKVGQTVKFTLRTSDNVIVALQPQ